MSGIYILIIKCGLVAIRLAIPLQGFNTFSATAVEQWTERSRAASGFIFSLIHKRKNKGILTETNQDFKHLIWIKALTGRKLHFFVPEFKIITSGD